MLDVSASQRIDEFEEALEGFRNEIESGTVLHTALVSSQILQGVDEIGLFFSSVTLYLSHSQSILVPL